MTRSAPIAEASYRCSAMENELVASSSSWLLDLARDRIDRRWNDAIARAKQRRTRFPGLTSDALANEVINDAASWAMIVGVGVGAVRSIPAVGQAIGCGILLPEFAYLTLLEFDAAIEIATIYESHMRRDLAVPSILACLAFSLGHDYVKSIATEVGLTISRHTIERFFQTSTARIATRIAETVGLQFTKNGLIRMVPFAAVPINAIMNYSGLQIFGLGAKHYFSPNWLMCGSCGSIQPRRSKFCAQCAKQVN